MRDNNISPTLLFACRIGSSVLVPNAHDTDILLVTDNSNLLSQRLLWGSYDIFIYPLHKFEQQLSYENFGTAYQNVCFALLKSSDVLYGEFPLPDYSFKDHYKDALQACLAYGELNYFNPDVSAVNGNCPKSMIWALATYFVVLNDSTEFTSEQRDLIQKCHDMDLPREYAWELKTKIENLLQQLG